MREIKNNSINVDLLHFAILMEYALFRLTSPEYITHKRFVEYGAILNGDEIVTVETIQKRFWRSREHIVVLLSEGVNKLNTLEKGNRPGEFRFTEEGRRSYNNFCENIKRNFLLLSKTNSMNLYNALVFITAPFYKYTDKPKITDLTYNTANIVGWAERELFKSEKRIATYMLLSKVKILNDANIASDIETIQKTIPSKSYYTISDQVTKLIKSGLLKKDKDNIYITKDGLNTLDDILDYANKKFDRYLNEKIKDKDLLLRGIGAIQKVVPKVISEDYDRITQLPKPLSYKWPRRGNLTDVE